MHGGFIDMKTMQTPPDVKVLVTTATTSPVDLVRVAAIGRTAVGTWAADTEYFRHGDLANAHLDADELRITCEKFPAGYTAQDVQTHLGTLAPSFTSPRTSPVWSPRRRPDTANRSLYLFSMPDPESPAHPIGLLFEVDPSRALAAVAFYKTWSPTTGLVWPEAVLPFTATLTRVKGRDGRASTDPADMILSYFTVMGS